MTWEIDNLDSFEQNRVDRICAYKLNKYFGNSWIANPLIAEEFLIGYLRKSKNFMNYPYIKQVAQCFVMNALSYYL